MTMKNSGFPSGIYPGADGLVPVVTIDVSDGTVLMLAYADVEALSKTLETGLACYFSRSRSRLWVKGETSGHTQHVKRVLVDCDGDSLIYEVVPDGPACHTGNRSCFYRELTPAGLSDVQPATRPLASALRTLEETIASRLRDRPAGSYVVELTDQGLPAVTRKVGEEALEVVHAALTETPDRLVAETADLFFFSLVLLAMTHISPEEVGGELLRRHRPNPSGPTGQK